MAVLAGMIAVVAIMDMVAVVPIVGIIAVLAIVVGIVMVAIAPRLVVTEAKAVPVRTVSASDRVTVVTLNAPVGVAVAAVAMITVAVASAAVTATLTAAFALGMGRAGRKLEISGRIQHRDDRRRCEHESDGCRRDDRATIGFADKIPRHHTRPQASSFRAVARAICTTTTITDRRGFSNYPMVSM